ncbi:centrosomal protein of 55 kDa-like [Eucyclogobius newberryi]|uniref:centrosomal protein of 55 kDa-like n=1 Tax=Eucyclogobius newberryi TaxID=166745 RepID=UPI003B5A562F
MAAARARVVNDHLKRENTFLLKRLNEQTRHYNEHNRIIEKCLALVAHQPSSPEFEAEGTDYMPLLMPKGQSDVNMRRLRCYANEIEEIKDELVSISARCQYLESNAEKEQEGDDDVQDDCPVITELQNKLNDAIEKNKQLMDYDQQRETYVKSIITRMLWLERRLHEVSKVQVAERNEFLSDEKRKIKQVECYYEGLMQKSSEELDVLREQVCLLQRELTKAQTKCREKQFEVDQLQQHLQCDKDAQNSVHITSDEEENPAIEAEDQERHKSATLERQSGLRKYFLNHYHKAQRQMAKFKRRADHPDRNRAHRSDLPPLPPKTCRSPYKSVMEDSFIECPVCHIVYPASQYKELIDHLDYCQN